jgi:hypothetical protein
MNNIRFTLLAVSLLTLGVRAAEVPAPTPGTANDVLRVWHDTGGRTVQATFRGIENGQVFLQTANGVVASVPLERLTPEDRAIAERLKPEGLGIPTDPYLPSYAKRIDEIVGYGLKAHNVEPNALASDEQFCRRVFLDLAGRIPTREETMTFLGDTSVSKRAKLIDRLLVSDGFTARMFSCFTDMLRMADDAQKAKFFTYEEWFKDQLRKNRPYNEIVFDLMTASGKLIENGATGYLLRDKGMRLDNLSVTLSTFLGANVACAQCHDHPFADWTQRQFYEMAAFFGTTETYDQRGAGKMLASAKKELTADEAKRARRLLQVNALEVYDTGHNELKLPDDYRYKDGKAGDPVSPHLIKWSPKTDVQKLALPDPSSIVKLQGGRDSLYKLAEAELAKKKGAENPRLTFAKWMTSPQNPRFSMVIANRLWKLIFGVAVKEPVNDLDDPNDSNNPMLLGHLGNEMVRLKFDIRAFMRLLCNTQAYQREACTQPVVVGEPYFFPGPILRRMTAEQAWDSCIALIIGDRIDNYKLKRADTYASIFDIKGDITASGIREKLSQMKSAGGQFAKNAKPGKPGKPGAKKPVADSEEDDDVDHSKPDVLQGQVLARASELPQPEREQHFLRMFGQSDRQIQDTNTDEGSIPQVLMLMNGQAQSVLRNPKSLVLATAMKESTPEKQIESLYYSFFTRHPGEREIADAKEALAGGLTVSDLTWVLFNSREFVFVQ